MKIAHPLYEFEYTKKWLFSWRGVAIWDLDDSKSPLPLVKYFKMVMRNMYAVEDKDDKIMIYGKFDYGSSKDLRYAPTFSVDLEKFYKRKGDDYQFEINKEF